MKRFGAYHQCFYHFVWSTKERLPLLTADVESRIIAYIANKCAELSYKLLAVNGASDHLHLLVQLSPTILVADVAKNLKGSSSHYINKECNMPDTLYWQDGYAVLTMRADEVPRVVTYINNQKKHHEVGPLSNTLERIEP